MREGITMTKTGLGALALMLCAGIAAADPLEGLWQTEADDGAFAHVDIAPCGPNFCGKIARSFKEGAEYASPNQGKTLVIDMAATTRFISEKFRWRVTACSCLGAWRAVCCAQSKPGRVCNDFFTRVCQEISRLLQLKMPHRAQFTGNSVAR